MCTHSTFSISRTRKPQSICLVAPLISKLPKAVQGRVLKVAGRLSLDTCIVGGNLIKVSRSFIRLPPTSQYIVTSIFFYS